MKNPVDNYWQIRLQETQAALEKNNFEAFVSESVAEARDLVLKQIIPSTGAESISWGGSGTFTSTGLYEILKDDPAYKVLDTYDKSLNDQEKMERRRQALLCDLFITGTNAVTEKGQLVNLDMIGNRIGALTFGPKNVIVVTGRNKIVSDVKAAMFRIRDFVAPANAMRLDMKTPCVQTARCQDCKSPGRICNTWMITEKSFPGRRIKIVLINADLGL